MTNRQNKAAQLKAKIRLARHAAQAAVEKIDEIMRLVKSQESKKEKINVLS